MSITQVSDIRFHESRLGIKMLDPYTRYDVKMRFIVEAGEFTGLSGSIDYTGLRRAKALSYNSLEDKSKQEHQDRVATEKYCIITTYAEGYKVNDPIEILDLYGVHHWTTFTELKRRKPLGVPSYGEFLIYQLLRENKITFTPQHKIETALGAQRLSFYLPKEHIAIEYQGVQHYKDVPYFSKSLEEQKVYDQAKVKHCQLNNINLIQVPYTVTDAEDVVNILVGYGVPIKDAPHTCGEVSAPLTAEAIVEYYSQHTKKETAEYFDVPTTYVQRVAVNYGFRKKGCKPKTYKDSDVLSLYIDSGLTRKEVADKLDISLSTVTNVAKRYGYSKSSKGVVNKK